MKGRPPLLPVLLLGLVLFGVGAWWGIEPTSRTSWAIDAIDPADVLGGMDRFFADGWHSRYPPAHFYVLGLIYLPFALASYVDVVDVWNPPITPALILIGNFVSLVMGLGILAVVHAVVRELGGTHRAAVLAALITALSPLMVYYSKTTNLDVPYCLWFSISLLYLVRIAKQHRLSDYVVFAAVSTLAVCTKDQAAGLYILTTGVVALLLAMRRSQEGSGSLGGWVGDRRLLIPTAVGLGLFALLHNLPMNVEGFLAHVRLILGPASDSYALPATASTYPRLVMLSAEQVVGGLGWPAALVCVLGVGHVLLGVPRTWIWTLLLVPLISYLLTFVFLARFTFDRFWLPAVIALAPFGGRLIDLVIDRASGTKVYRVAAACGVILLFGYGCLRASSLDLLMIYDGRNHVEDWLEERFGRDVSVLGVGFQEYLPQLVDFPRSDLSLSPTLEDLQATAPDVVILTATYDSTRFAQGSAEREFFRALNQAETDYALCLDHRGTPPLTAIRQRADYLKSINPDIRVFAKECI